ncbi:phage major capsid protein [Dysgonomonas macrotermitis]|uniref:Phage major capsid protein, HK97 family n=1 Tax=Dysgonomonas macrotermitis TaxID=1346286 RepID=A0A1M5C526_9BACT|nr:phage major capsid protein [Dysgonomonas macrotermitis]SHF49780.1 phage major capsid protein, HK97 family [Dysgonomonas macrotermitis]
MKIIDSLDKSKLTEDQVKFFEGLDASIESAIGSGVKEYLGGEIDLKGLEARFDAAEKKIEEFGKKDFGDKFDKKELDELKEEVNKTLLRLKAATEAGKDGSVKIKSIDTQIREQLEGFIGKDSQGREVVNLKGACKASDNGKRKQFRIFFDRKAAAPVTTSGGNIISGVVVDPSISAPVRAESDIRDYASVATIGARSVTYGELYDITGDAAWVPEGGLKPSMTAKVREITVTAGKVALTVKLTEETITDLPQLVAEIRTEIINRIGLAEEEGILFGTGADGEILGVFTTIPEFTLTGLSVDKPNYFDAIVAAYTQVVSVSKMNFRPNLVRVNPIDLANMNLTKDVNGQYLFPPFSLGNGEIISGLRIVPSPSVDQGFFFLGDFSYLNIRDYISLTIEIGWENDDFTKNMVTMIGEKRLLAYIKSNYLIAFVKGEYTSIMEAIETPETVTT